MSQAEKMWDQAMGSAQRLLQLKIIAESLGHDLSFPELVRLDEQLRQDGISVKQSKIVSK